MNPKAKTVPLNGIGHTIFNNVKVSLNGTQIDSGSTLYPYRGHFKTRLSYPQSVKDSFLDMIGFDEEQVSFEDVMDVNMRWENLIDETLIPDTSNHPQLGCRFVNSVDSQTMHIMTPIHSEIFDQNKWLPLHSTLYISVEQNSSHFALMNKEGGIGEHPLKVKIEKCELLVRMIEVDSSMTKEIENVSYEGSSMLFPLRCVKMEQHRIAANMGDISVSNILVGEDELPQQIFLAFVRHEAVNRNLALDPFNYRHFSMDCIGLRIGGVE